jgi:hypothetical protein
MTKKRQRQPRKKPPKRTPQSAIHTLKVTLIDGPVTEEFLEENPVVSRTIRMRGGQTLADLHGAIFRAFDRAADDHLYRFEFDKKPHDRDPVCYDGAGADISFFGVPPGTEDVHRVKIGELGLKARGKFFYQYDFGDDWWHRIKVVSTNGESDGGEYPRVTDRVGESPPQYPGLEEYEDDWE